MDIFNNFASAVRGRLSHQGRGEQGSLPVVMIVLSFVLAITLALISALNLQVTKLRQEQNDIYRSVALDSGVAYAAQKMFSVSDTASANKVNLPKQFGCFNCNWVKAPDGEGYFRVKRVDRGSNFGEYNEVTGFVVEAIGGDPEFSCKPHPTVPNETVCNSELVTMIYKYDPLKEYGKKKLVEENSKETPWVLVSRKPYDYTVQFDEAGTDGTIFSGNE